MKKTFVYLLSLMFVLTLTSCKKNKLSQNSKLIPKGTNIIAEINFKDLMKLKTLTKEYSMEGQIFSKVTGIKLENIKTVTLFATANASSDMMNNIPEFGILIDGKGFSKDMFKKIPKSLKKVKYLKETIFQDPESKMVFTLIGKTIAGGNLNQTKKVMDIAKGKGKSADLSDFQSLFSKLNAKSLKAGLLVPEKAKKDLKTLDTPYPVDGLTETLANLDKIAIGANISSDKIEVKLVLQSKKSSIKKLVKGIKDSLKMFGPQIGMLDKSMPGFKKAYDSLKYEADGNYFKVSFTIPSKLLNNLK